MDAFPGWMQNMDAELEAAALVGFSHDAGGDQVRIAAAVADIPARMLAPLLAVLEERFPSTTARGSDP